MANAEHTRSTAIKNRVRKARNSSERQETSMTLRNVMAGAIVEEDIIPTSVGIKIINDGPEEASTSEVQNYIANSDQGGHNNISSAFDDLKLP